MTAVRYPDEGVTAQLNGHSLKPVVASLGRTNVPPLQVNRDAESVRTQLARVPFFVVQNAAFAADPPPAGQAR